MVFPSVTFTDGRFHKTRKRWKHVDRWVDALVIQLPINENLAFGDVACKIRDRVCNVWKSLLMMARALSGIDLTIVGHRENGNLSNRAITALDTSRTLVNCGQISVHIPGIATTSRHFFSRSGNLSKGIAVSCQISEDNQYVLFELVGIVFCSSECETRSNDTLDPSIYQSWSEWDRMGN